MPPSRVGRFTLVNELGSGGMGRVYRAHDPALERDVAIKVLREDASGGDLLAEARSASGLKHPNICAIYDVGEDAGAAFIAMELVDGRPLSEHIAPGGLPVRTALELAVEIAGALAHAHEHGVIHGDLKGHNVVVTPKGDVKLLDFGLARTLERATFDSITRSAPVGAGIAGTLPFMAPETLRGAPLTAAADVWALGVLLQEMLTGERPFAGSTTLDLASAILNEPPRALPASVPSAVAAVVARCLEKSPARRYATAREPLAALEPLLTGAGWQSPPPVAPGRRSRRSAIAAGVILLALAAGGLWIWSRAGGNAAATPQVSSIMVLPFESLSRNSDEDFLAEGMTDALITDLSRISSLTVISRTSSRRYKALGKSAPEIAAELHIGAIVDGSVQRAGDQVRISVRLVDAAADRNLWGHEYTREMKDVLVLQGEVARAIAGEIRASFAPADEARLAAAQSIRPEAHEEYLKGRHHWNRRSEDGLAQAIVHFRRAIDLQPDYAAAYAGLAQSYVVQPLFPIGTMSPTEAFAQTVKAAEAAISYDDRLSDAHAALAYARLYLRGFADADLEFRRALELNQGDATAHFWYAAALSSVGRFDDALQHAKQAASLDPVSPIIQAGVSWMHHLARRFDLEVDAARRALELDDSFMIARVRLGTGLLHLGRYDEALAEMEKARALTNGSPELIAAVGYAEGRAGRRQRALAALAELEQISASGKRYVSPFAIGLLHVGLGNRDEAFTWLRRAADERHPVVAFAAVEADLDPIRSDPRFASLTASARK